MSYEIKKYLPRKIVIFDRKMEKFQVEGRAEIQTWYFMGRPALVFGFLKDFTYLFLEGGERREKERERNNDRLPLACPLLGTWPTTQACALTGNGDCTSDLSVCRLALNPLSHTSQGQTSTCNEGIWGLSGYETHHQVVKVQGVRLNFLKKILFFRERGEGEREGQEHLSVAYMP